MEAFVTKIIMHSSDFIMQIIKQHGYHFVIVIKKAIKNFRPSTIFAARSWSQVLLQAWEVTSPQIMSVSWVQNENPYCCTMQWYQFSIAGNPISKQRPRNEDIQQAVGCGQYPCMKFTWQRYHNHGFINNRIILHPCIWPGLYWYP